MDIVLNWVWQGGVVALATALILRVIPPHRTRARYSVAWAACAAVLMLPAVALTNGILAPTGTGLPPPASVAMPALWWTSSTAALAVWALWAVHSLSRTGAAVVALRRTKRQACDFPRDVEAQLAHWRRVRGTGRRARLVLSNAVRTAGVLGGRTPVIAVAPMLLERLTAADLDRVVVHEWAHVQRHDDVAQIGVRMMLAIAGWHPAVWWLQRQLHIEREVACDEMAVGVTGSPKAYALCLASLAGLRAARVSVPALAAVSSSGLHQRIRRIVARRDPGAARWPRLMPLAAVAAIALVAAFVGPLQVVRMMASIAAPEAMAPNQVLEGAPDAVVFSRVDHPARPPIASRTRALANVPEPAQQSHEPADVVADSPPAPLVSTTLPLTGEAFVPLDHPVALIPQDPQVPAATAATPQPPWGTAVEAAKAIGAGSEQAAIATAGFFARVGKQVARSF